MQKDNNFDDERKFVINNSMENILKGQKHERLTGKFTSWDEAEEDSPKLSTDFYIEYFWILESIHDSWNSWIYWPRSAPGLSLDID